MKVVHGLAVHAGGKGLPSTEEIDAQLAELSAALPNLTYKTTNARVPATAPKVLPAHVVYDKKVSKDMNEQGLMGCRCSALMPTSSRRSTNRRWSTFVFAT